MVKNVVVSEMWFFGIWVNRPFYIQAHLAVLPCLGPKQSLNPGAPQRHRQGLLHRSYMQDSRSQHSWLRLSSGGAGNPSHCRQTEIYNLVKHPTNTLWSLFKKKKKKDQETLLGETLESNNSQWLQEYLNITQKTSNKQSTHSRQHILKKGCQMSFWQKAIWSDPENTL